jgi:hypothetical protein
MTDQQVSSFSLYEELKLRGVDLSWYDRRKHPKLVGDIPLENKRCSRLSIYLLKRDGSLWTVKSDDEGYSKVRQSERAMPRDVYVCLCCKAQWPAMPTDHKEGDS